jgi:hypothetical protein
MAKYASATTLRKRAEQGRGSGEGPEYEGLVGVRDFSSKGYSHRIWGFKSGRMHQFVSNGELACYYLLDWNDGVVDILDQAALDLEETTALAAELGYEHPSAGSEGLVPMTTDLVAVFGQDTGGGRLAVSVKKRKELGQLRVAEKLELERRYWERRGVQWQIATEEQFDDVVVANLGHLYGYRSLERYDVPKETEEADAVLGYLHEQVRATARVPLARVCAATDERLGLVPGAAITLAWYAVATKRWVVDLGSPLKGHLPLPLVSAV